MSLKFMNVVYGLIFFIVGSVILLTILPALLPTFYDGLNETNQYSYFTNHTGATAAGDTYTLPLANLFSLDGILPLVLVEAVFLALVIGAIAMIKGSKKR